MAGSCFDAHYHIYSQGMNNQPGILNTTGPEEWSTAFRLMSSQHPGQVISLGIHPWFIREDHINEDLQTLAQLLKNAPQAAVGETGLDKLKGPEPELQTRVFLHQLELAKELDRIVSIHCVRSWGGVLQALREKRPRRFVIHSTQTSGEMVREFTQMAGTEGYLSFGFRALVPNSKAHQALSVCPEDRLLLETDGPYPQGFFSPDTSGRIEQRPVNHEQAIETWFAHAETLLTALRGKPRQHNTWRERILENAQILTHRKTTG